MFFRELEEVGGYKFKPPKLESQSGHLSESNKLDNLNQELDEILEELKELEKQEFCENDQFQEINELNQ